MDNKPICGKWHGNDVMPICPHCREKIDLEKLANGVWVRKVEK